MSDPGGDKLSAIYVDDETGQQVEDICGGMYNPPSMDEFVSRHFQEFGHGPSSAVFEFVIQMFPEVDRDRLKILTETGTNVNDIVNYLLQHPEVRSGCKTKSSTVETARVPAKEVNYFKEYSTPVSYNYEEQCLSLLKNDFRQLYMHDIRAAMKKYKGHYAPARRCLEESLVTIRQRLSQPDDNTASSGTETTSKFSPPCIPIPSTSATITESPIIPIKKLLANKRNRVLFFQELDEELQLEVEFVKKQNMLKEEKKDEIYAQHLNEQQYEEEGQLIECGCCYGEFPFERIVQCSDGHLFCCQCLQSYAKEVIFGSAIATANLHCMTGDCTKPFPFNQLAKCLTEEEINKYQERLQEDCLTKVDLPNLVHCPFCEFAAIVDGNEKVFTCLNPKCGKETCKDCQEEWKDHVGLKCSEVEKKVETNLRLSYEEKMSMAKIRKCPKCSCQFTKSEGCNKMTCRCGQTMCYVCRKAGICYKHFCAHIREPGKQCTRCKACSLWSDPSEDEQLAIQQLEQEAAVAKRKLSEELMSAKKQKTEKIS